MNTYNLKDDDLGFDEIELGNNIIKDFLGLKKVNNTYNLKELNIESEVDLILNENQIKLERIFQPYNNFWWGSFISINEIQDETYIITEDETEISFFAKTIKSNIKT